jgi:hypothetical protein
MRNDVHRYGMCSSTESRPGGTACICIAGLLNASERMFDGVQTIAQVSIILSNGHHCKVIVCLPYIATWIVGAIERTADLRNANRCRGRK